MMNDDNRPWDKGDNPDQTVNGEIKPDISADDTVIDLGDDYDFDEFEVVRREFFAHMNEPAVTFNDKLWWMWIFLFPIALVAYVFCDIKEDRRISRIKNRLRIRR